MFGKMVSIMNDMHTERKEFLKALIVYANESGTSIRISIKRK